MYNNKWQKTLTCICGKEIKLDFLGKNFKNHISTDPTHLKLLKKQQKIKAKQGKPPLFIDANTN